MIQIVMRRWEAVRKFDPWAIVFYFAGAVVGLAILKVVGIF